MDGPTLFLSLWRLAAYPELTVIVVKGVGEALPSERRLPRNHCASIRKTCTFSLAAFVIIGSLEPLLDTNPKVSLATNDDPVGRTFFLFEFLAKPQERSTCSMLSSVGNQHNL